MNEEQEILSLSMDCFRKVRDSNNAALSKYLKILPEEFVQGVAMQLLRQHFKQRQEKRPLSDEEKTSLSVMICQQVINESILKLRKAKTAANSDLDGAELFYRRALKHMAMERFNEAERSLKRSVEICPDFADGWDAFADVLQRNGKLEQSQKARLKVRQLKNTL